MFIYICRMILSDSLILAEIEKGTIVIEPYDRSNLGSNSYDVHLGKYLAMYDEMTLDARKHNTIRHMYAPIPCMYPPAHAPTPRVYPPARA